jgi:subtilase family serine protease
VHPLGVASNTHAGVAVATECRHAYKAACLTPQELNSAYFPGQQPDGPSAQSERQTIALVDAYNDPNAEHDLQVYDDELKLPECTHGNGCFEQVNEHGDAEPGSLPFPKSETEREAVEAICRSKKTRENGAERTEREAACKAVEEAAGWSLEIATDVEAAHGICQNCRILLVEASSPGYGELETAEDTAVAHHATEISNSWGGQEIGAGGGAFNHPGIPITAAAGDDGYLNWDQYDTRGEADSPYFQGADYPASSPDVVAVGGTSLTVKEGGGWESETVWNNKEGAGGGGCGDLAAQPWQQQDSEMVGCPGSERSVADVSADADPVTGVAIYDSVPFPEETEPLDWVPVGGTSLASPIVASMFALAGGAHGVEYPAQALYSHLGSSLLHDVTGGGNGECDDKYSSCSGSLTSPLDCGAGAWICNATVGYDGPTGVGTPNGLGAFRLEGGAQKSKLSEEQAKAESGGSSSGSSSASPPSSGLGGTSGATPGKPGSAAGSAAAQVPRISGLALTVNARSALRHARLTLAKLAFSFSSSGAVAVRVTLAIRVRSARHLRWRALPGSLTIAAIKGLNRRRLHGSGALARGTYRLTLAPSGGASRSITISVP